VKRYRLQSSLCLKTARELAQKAFAKMEQGCLQSVKNNAGDPKTGLLAQYFAEFPDGKSQLCWVEKEEIAVEDIAKTGISVNISPDVADVLRVRYDVVCYTVWPSFDHVLGPPPEQGLSVDIKPDCALLSIVDDPDNHDSHYRTLGFSHNVIASFLKLSDANELAFRVFHDMAAPKEMNDSDRIFYRNNITKPLNDAIQQLKDQDNMGSAPFSLEFTAPYDNCAYSFPYRYIKVVVVKTKVPFPQELSDWIENPERCVFTAEVGKLVEERAHAIQMRAGAQRQQQKGAATQLQKEEEETERLAKLLRKVRRAKEQQEKDQRRERNEETEDVVMPSSTMEMMRGAAQGKESNAPESEALSFQSSPSGLTAVESGTSTHMESSDDNFAVGLGKDKDEEESGMNIDDGDGEMSKEEASEEEISEEE
jgi:hypothetical protein